MGAGVVSRHSWSLLGWLSFLAVLCGGTYMKTIQHKGAGFLKFLKWIILNENPDRQLDAVNDIKSLEI